MKILKGIPYLVIICLLLASKMGLLACASAKTPPNIVFILVDDMGYGDLGCMGCSDIATPNIDRLADEGVRFTDFYANAPVCSPTRCAFITGQWQQRVGFEWALGYSAERRRLIDGTWRDITTMHHGIGLPSERPGIAKMMKAAGYKTGCFGKWHLGYDDEFNPLNHGFDEYFGELLGHADYYRHSYYDGTYALRDGFEYPFIKGYFTDLVNERAESFIEKNHDSPFFLYVPHLALHAPFQPPDRPLPHVTPKNMHDGSRDIYRQMLERVDHGVGMILDQLEEHGLVDNTLVVLSSDNGGERWSNNLPLFHHKRTLWEGGIRVPCVMRWPNRIKPGTVSSQPAITMDLTATFLSAARAIPPTDYQLDGIDLMPVLAQQASQTDRTFYWRVNRSNYRMRAIRHGDWKYIDDAGTMDLLFDLKNDISERKNLCYQNPEKVKELKKLLAAWEAEMDAEPKTFTVH